MIRYVSARLELHGLEIKTRTELDELGKKIVSAVRVIHPNLQYDSDVDFEIDEKAGEFVT